MPEPGLEPAVDVAVVVPVYQGELTLERLLEEIAPLTRAALTPAGRAFRVAEVVLVHDGARDRSAEVMLALAERHPFLRLVWLSRNFGQHAATLAGMASTTTSWVATLDEDGQQDPRDVGRLLDEAIAHGALLVYAHPTNRPPHGALRNAASASAKWAFVHLLGNRTIGRFNSFRLVRGDVARAVAAYCGANVYLDVALGWVVDTARHTPVRLREERGRSSGYGLRRLFHHFWQLVLTSGTRPLRLIALLGIASVVAGMAVTSWVIYGRIVRGVPVAGWTSTMIALSLVSGLALFSLGVIAEYLGVAVSMALGKPPYLVVSKPSGRAGPRG